MLSWIRLDALLDVVQHVGCKLQQLFALVLFVVYLDGRGVIGQAGHLEGTESGSWVATATEAFLIELEDAIFLFGLGRVITVVFLDPHQGDVLLVDFILDLEMIDERTEIVK